MSSEVLLNDKSFCRKAGHTTSDEVSMRKRSIKHKLFLSQGCPSPRLLFVACLEEQKERKICEAAEVKRREMKGCNSWNWILSHERNAKVEELCKQGKEEEVKLGAVEVPEVNLALFLN